MHTEVSATCVLYWIAGVWPSPLYWPFLRSSDRQKQNSIHVSIWCSFCNECSRHFNRKNTPSLLLISAFVWKWLLIKMQHCAIIYIFVESLILRTKTDFQALLCHLTHGDPFFLASLSVCMSVCLSNSHVLAYISRWHRCSFEYSWYSSQIYVSTYKFFNLGHFLHVFCLVFELETYFH